jgi:peroxiredoxin
MALINTPLCDFGKKMPNFNLPDTDGKPHDLESLMGENGLLIAFICNHCPYVQAIIDRLVMDANELKNHRINTVAIMSNDFASYPDDSPDKMKAFIVEHNMQFPYLIDETQGVARAYDAVCTPDFFGINKDKGLQYRGRLDNLPMNAQGERVPELLKAMQQIAETGQGPEEQTPSMGCSIKWK